MQLETLLSFEEAIQYVIDHRDSAAFAFYPTKKNGAVVGGVIFALENDDDPDDGEASWIVNLMESRFHSSCGIEDVMWGESFDEPYETDTREQIDPCSLLYKRCPRNRIGQATGYEMQVAVAIFNGVSEDEAKSIELQEHFGFDVPAGWDDWLTAHLPIGGEMLK